VAASVAEAGGILSIVVVGSLNVDRFSVVERLPRPGETVTARDGFVRFGGKGANQAIAAARLGAQVAMIGAVGADTAGGEYRQRLKQEGIEAAAVVEKAWSVGTGSAVIAVEASGENHIIVHPGANGQLTAADVQAARASIAAATVLLVQSEVPLEAVTEAMRVAEELAVPVVFNPSPWREDFPWTAVKLHTVIVNETELTAWLGEARFPSELRIERVVLTRGGDPTVGLTRDRTLTALPPSIQPMDTVGAGDAFAGAYAVALAEGQAFEDALRFANLAGALATQRPGAQEALPDRALLNACLADPARIGVASQP
jgi:ribokinase